MIYISDKTKCCGCTACMAVCPKQCIKMKPDEEGFLYPETDVSSCINCGRCDRVCPMTKPAAYEKDSRKTVALRSTNKDVVSGSTSGGFFIPLANNILSCGGIICAAAFDENFTVRHMIIESINDIPLSRFSGSKYVQSNVGDSFTNVKKSLAAGRKVCFVGTPCQVNGLKKYLKKDYENLITVDLVCHGVPSPMLWKKYIDYQMEVYGSSVESVTFRSKIYGYHSGGYMDIRFTNGKKYVASAKTDYMLKSFFKEISSRPVCYECPFKSMERCSDLTLYDCWHFGKLTGRKDDDRGYTNVIVQSEKGEKLLESLGKDIELTMVDTEQAHELDGVMIDNRAKPHPKRKEFYKRLKEVTLDEHIQKLIPISRKDRMMEKIKVMLYRIGILQMIKNKLQNKK